MSLQLSPQLKLEQHLSQRLQYAAQILQMSTLDIQQLLEQSQDNPCVDYSVDMEFPNEGDQSKHTDISTWQNTLAAPYPRQQSLYENIRLSRANQTTKLLCYVIIDALDENGYLTQHFTSLLPPDYPEVSEGEWQSALSLVQQLSPAGVAARDLQEALHLQVRALGLNNPTLEKALHHFIDHDLNHLAQGDLNFLNKYSVLATTVLNKELLSMVRRLNPKPGLVFSQDTHVQRIPDVFLVRHKEQWLIQPNRQSMPTISVPLEYGQYLTQHKHKLLRQQLNEAQQLSQSLAMRKTTICRVAACIVQHQQLFFELGEQALQPLTLRQLAQELGLHESTISRATTDKYMSTPMGIFSFRFFFSNELETDFGGVCSSSAAKSLIRELIKAEPPMAPLSDVALHQELLQRSIKISKRTITKYRLQMRIPNAKERLQRAILQTLSAN